MEKEILEEGLEKRLEGYTQKAKMEWEGKRKLALLALDKLAESISLSCVEVQGKGYTEFLMKPAFLWELDRFELFFSKEADGYVYRCVVFPPQVFPEGEGEVKIYRESSGMFERLQDGYWVPTRWKGELFYPIDKQDQTVEELREAVTADFDAEENVFERKKELLFSSLCDCKAALEAKGREVVRIGFKSGGVERFLGECYGGLETWEDEPVFLFDIEGHNVHVARMERDRDYEEEGIGFRTYIYEDFEGYDYADPERYKKEAFWEDYEPNWDEEELVLDKIYSLEVY